MPPVFNVRVILMVLACCSLAAPAQAYVGPGLGLGTLGAVLGFGLSIVLAILALIWYPIKRMLRKKGAPRTDAKDQESQKEC
jgi:hypothetical protein